jgi:ABC-type transport system substrate-binding protein
MCRASTLDVNIGMIDPDNVNELAGLGWSISQNPGFHMCYHGINCRVIAPDTAGGYWDYHGRTPGFPLYPLEINQFRLALEYIVGCEKDAWIAEIYQFINVRIDTTIPPANSYWYNPYITPYPEDWAKAETLLLAAGFTWDYGGDATPHTTDDIWWMPNGDVLWDGTTDTTERWAGDAWGIYVLCPGDGLAPTSHELSRRNVRKWNSFFTGEALDAALFIDEPTDDIYHLILPPFYNRDYDIYMLCWGLGSQPDYLYDFFHPEADVPGADNSPGLVNEPMDALIKALKFWMMEDFEVLDYNVGDLPAGKVLPACTTYTWTYILPTPAPILDVKVQRCTQEGGVYYEYLTEGVEYTVVGPNSIHLEVDITLYPGEALEVNFDPGTYSRVILDRDQMRDYCWLIQWKLYYLAPYLPLYSRNYINAFKPGLESWVESGGFGSCPTGTMLHWTLGSLHWTGVPVGGSINWHISGDTGTLNPISVQWAYEVMMWARVYDGLTTTNPYTHDQEPWVALGWKMVPWTSPPEEENVPNGMYIKIWLRDDVYWQDGSHVTAEDIKWNYDFIKSINPPEFDPIPRLYVKSEVVNDYCIKIYVNGTGEWFQNLYMGSALIFPRVIWEPFWGDYDNAILFSPWSVTYTDWTGCIPQPGPGGVAYPALTCLYGTGPWVLDFWNEVDTAHYWRNANYWPQIAAVGTAQLGGVFTQDQCYKKIFEGFNGPHAEVMENVTVVDMNDPVGSEWIDVPPTLLAFAKIDSWVDNGDGVLSPSDQILLYKNGPDYCETEWWHVDAVDPAGSQVFISIVEVQHIPKMTKPFIDVVIQNINTKDLCDYTWELWMDGTVLIDSGGGTLVPVETYTEKLFIDDYRDIAPCVHTWTLVITTIHGTDVYEIDMAYTIGDTNCDSKVDLVDIFAIILAYGSQPGDVNWTADCDINNDEKVDLIDLFTYGILFYGIECHS